MLGDRYSKATTETQEGARDFAGAKFAKDVAGNKQREASLSAALGALPDKAAATALPELLDVLRATGRRKPIGSATEFNRAANADLSEGGVISNAVGAVRSLGASLLTKAGDKVQRAALGKNVTQLADLFTDPRSVDLIREMLAKGPNVRTPETAARLTVQSLFAGNR